MKLSNLFIEATSIILCIQSVVSLNPFRTLLAPQPSDPLVDDPVGIISSNGRVNVRNSRILQATGDFLPLTCNTITDETQWNCVPWPFGLETVGAVYVPCNICYTMEQFTDADTTIVLNGPLNIKGKLHFPDGTKLTLVTPGIIVQGQLSIKSTKLVDGIPDIIFRFTGEITELFIPDEPNAHACGQQGCNLGSKPFLVAGGTVHINGLPDHCPTWTTIIDVIADGYNIPLSYPHSPDLPLSSEGLCTQDVIAEDFELGLNKWYGNVGADESIKDHAEGGSYLHISRRSHEYQGPMLDLSFHLRQCLMTDQDYFFTARVRISPDSQDPSKHSKCHSTGDSCPKLQFSHMDNYNTVRWRELITTDFTDVQDNTWFVIHQTFNIPHKYVPAYADDVYSLFSINGVEPGIDISIDDISIILPPSEAYPNPADACLNLVVNGDAEQLGLFPYPIRPYVKKSTVTIKEENSNSYFSITKRNDKFDSVTIDLNPECLQTSSIYTFSANIRLNSASSDKPIVRLISTIPGIENPEIFNFPSKCPETSSAIGWTTCEIDLAIDSKLSIASQAQLLIMFEANQIDRADFDDISFTFKNAIREGELQLRDDLSSCYAPGAKALIPSDNLVFNTEQIVTLENISSDNFVATEEDIVRTSTYSNDPDFPTEFAVLSRNILFENDDDDSVRPSLVVLNTPNIKQLIQGVDFDGFGHASTTTTNGFPVNFISSQSPSTIMSKNTIQNSNNGCIKIATTHYISVSENVAYNTTGHCFVLQSGIGNTFERNLGALTKISTSPSTSPSTSETRSATFYIGHPANNFIGNVAAGSEHTGFFLQKHESDMISFSDNVSHSNKQYGLRSEYIPLNVNTWNNTKVYRNQLHGILFLKSRNIFLNGGVIADNARGIDIWTSDGITISGMKVMGFSESFKSIAEVVPGTIIHCHAVTGPLVIGVRVHPNAMSMVNTVGTKIDNVTFSGFDESTGCNPSSTAITFNSLTLSTKIYTTTVEVSRTTFDVTTGTSRNEISLCDTFTERLFDVYVMDDGSLNPSGVQSGIVVSNNSSLPSLGTCSPMSGSCAQYCIPDTTDVDPADPLNPADPLDPADPEDPLNPDAQCITNGDFTNGSDSWKALNSNTMSLTEGFDGSGLKVNGRVHQVRAGPAQEFDPSCLTYGQWYEVSVDVKLTHAELDTVFECDPTYMFYSDKTCGGIHFIYGTTVDQIAYTIAPLSNNGWNRIIGVFKASNGMIAASSIDLVVSRAPTDVDITVDNLVMVIAGPNTVGVKDCSNPLSNGNAEIGDARGWWIRGHYNNGVIEMGTPGYGEAGKAFKHLGARTNRLASMVQIMDGSCFVLGSTWRITAWFRFFTNDGEFVSCEKRNVNLATACPVFYFFAGDTSTGPIYRTDGALKNTDTSPIMVGDWNRIINTFTVKADMASQMQMWANVYAPVGYNYEIDDIQLIEIV